MVSVVSVGVDPVHVVARRHDGSDPTLAHAEGALDHLLLRLVHKTGRLGGSDEKLQLLGRVKPAFVLARVQAEQSHDGIAQAVQDEDGRTKDHEKQPQRAHDAQRCAFGLLQCHAFGHQFAKHDVEHRDDEERDRGRDGVSASRGHCAEGAEGRLDQSCESRLADPAEPERRDRDTELCRGQMVVEIAYGSAEDLGSSMTLSHEFIDAAPAYADERELCGHEEPVGSHQCKHGQQLAQYFSEALIRHGIVKGVSASSRLSDLVGDDRRARARVAPSRCRSIGQTGMPRRAASPLARSSKLRVASAIDRCRYRCSRPAAGSSASAQASINSDSKALPTPMC